MVLADTLGVEFLRRGILNVKNVAGELDDGELHSETDAEIGNVVFARVAGRLYDPLRSAGAKPTRDYYATELPILELELPCLDFFRVNKLVLQADVLVVRRVLQRLYNRLIGVLVIKIFADH